MNAAITLGGDPEVHVYDHDQAKIVSALRVLKGRDKHRPINLGDGIRMYADNVLIETAFPPTNCISDFMTLMKTVWVRAQEALTARYSLVPKAAHVYDKTELRGKKPWMSGCNPNFDVYAGAANVPANFSSGLRTGSFHVHVGHPALNTHDQKEIAIRLMDIFVGCASVIFDKDETAAQRRALYGRAGEYRPTPYGVEYRVLGNWALRSPETTHLVWDLVMHAVSHIDDDTARDVLARINANHVQVAINDHDEALASKVIVEAGLPYRLLERVRKDYGTPNFNKSWAI